MSIAPSIIFLPLLILGAICLILLGSRKDISSSKFMLLGMNITLFGGIIVVDPDCDIGFIGYLIAIIGVIISIVGLVKKD